MNFKEKILKISGYFRPDYFKSLFIRIKEQLFIYKNRIEQKVRSIVETAKSNERERRRIMLLSLSSLFFFCYLMICLLIDKNIFDIFPPVPAIKESRRITIYIPSEGAAGIIAEQRKVYSDLEDDKLVHRLFYLVAAGSAFENTTSNVPARLIIKTIWIVDSEDGQGKTCLIDIMPVILDKDIIIVKGSEQMFRDALEKTVVENVPGIKKVILLEKGVPYRKLWDI